MKEAEIQTPFSFSFILISTLHISWTCILQSQSFIFPETRTQARIDCPCICSPSFRAVGAVAVLPDAAMAPTILLECLCACASNRLTCLVISRTRLTPSVMARTTSFPLPPSRCLRRRHSIVRKGLCTQSWW